MVLSAHDCCYDTAIVMNPARLQESGRLHDTAADLMGLLGNMTYVLNIPQQAVRQWALHAVRTAPLTASTMVYPDVVPVGSARWFLSEEEENRLEQFGCFELLSDHAASDAETMHYLVTEYSYVPSTSPCASPTLGDWGSDMESAVCV
jgi:hypothetical protein